MIFTSFRNFLWTLFCFCIFIKNLINTDYSAVQERDEGKLHPKDLVQWKVRWSTKSLFTTKVFITSEVDGDLF